MVAKEDLRVAAALPDQAGSYTEVRNQQRAVAAVVFAHHLAVFPHIMSYGAADRLLVASILMIVQVDRRSTSSHYHPVLAVVAVAVHPIISHIAICIIAIVQR